MPNDPQPRRNPYDPPVFQEEPTKQPKGNFVPLLIGIPFVALMLWICWWGDLTLFSARIYLMFVVPIWLLVWLIRRLRRKHFSLFWFVILAPSVVGSILMWMYFMSTK
jgi:hypothetical protein